MMSFSVNIGFTRMLLSYFSAKMFWLCSFWQSSPELVGSASSPLSVLHLSYQKDKAKSNTFVIFPCQNSVTPLDMGGDPQRLTLTMDCDRVFLATELYVLVASFCPWNSYLQSNQIAVEMYLISYIWPVRNAVILVAHLAHLTTL